MSKRSRLKVCEALSKDVGRAYARMGPEDMAQLGAEVGDIVEVSGKAKAVCKAMPAYKEMRGQSRIQLDGLTRENAGVGLDEHVQIRRIPCPTAERVVLVPTNVVPSERDMEYIGSRLDAGRFDEIVEIPLLDEAGRVDIFRIQLRNKPLDREVNAQNLGSRTEGYSGADISAVCHQAALRAIRRAVHAGEEPVGSHTKVRIEATDLEAALQSIRR